MFIECHTTCLSSPPLCVNALYCMYSTYVPHTVQCVLYEVVQYSTYNVPHTVQCALYEVAQYSTYIHTSYSTVCTVPLGHVSICSIYSHYVNRYAAIVKYKTAFYSFYLPVGIAMYMVSLLPSSPSHHTQRH